MEVGFKYSLTKMPRGPWSAAPDPESPTNPSPRAPLLGEGTKPEPPALGGPQFLYSPALLEVLPEQDALTLLAQSLRDPSREVRALSLQGLGNILFHPEKVSVQDLWLVHARHPRASRARVPSQLCPSQPCG